MTNLSLYPHKKSLMTTNPKTKAGFTLGVRTDVQPKSSIPIGGKVEISHKGFYTRSQSYSRKKSFQSAPTY